MATKHRRRVRSNRRVRRNPDDNTLLYIGGAVGLYLAYRWWMSKSPPPATVTALPSNLDVEAGWTAYQARPTKAMDVTPMDRSTFNRFWALLSDAEKQAAVRWYGYSMDQMTAKMADPATQRDPAISGFLLKSVSVMVPAGAPPPNVAPPPPNVRGTSGLGAIVVL